MGWAPFFRPTTADTTKVTADRTHSQPLEAMARRLASLLPAGWFLRSPDSLRHGIFVGLASALTWLHAFTGYAKAQTRLGTSTGIWLDLAAYDFFGSRFGRRKGEVDDAFRPRLLAEIIRPRATREAIRRVVTDLTGIGPDIIEPWNPGDCGAYGSGTFAVAGTAGPPQSVEGWGRTCLGTDRPAAVFSPSCSRTRSQVLVAAQGAGALHLPNQIFVKVHRGPPTFPALAGLGGYGSGLFAFGGGQPGVPNPVGYGTIGGYGAGNFGFVIPAPPFGHFDGAGFYGTADEQVSITDAEIYRAIADTAAGGVIPWTMIRGA